MNIITTKDIAEWCSQFADNETVGFAGCSWACPIAQCLAEHKGATDISVGDEYITCTIRGERYEEEISGDIAAIKDGVDTCGESIVTAGTLREILARIPVEVA